MENFILECETKFLRPEIASCELSVLDPVWGNIPKDIYSFPKMRLFIDKCFTRHSERKEFH